MTHELMLKDGRSFTLEDDEWEAVKDTPMEAWNTMENHETKAVFSCPGCTDYTPTLPRYYEYPGDAEEARDSKFCMPCIYRKRGLPDDFKVFNYEELVNMPEENIDWVVHDFVPAKGVTILGGKRSSYKTWIALNLALAVASGSKFLGQYDTNKRNVLYINQENPTPVIAARLRQLKELSAKGRDIGFINFSGFNFNKPVWPDWLEKTIEREKIGLIVADPFAGCHDIKEDDAGEMRLLLTNILGRLANKHGCAFILIHHLRKGVAGGGRVQSNDPMDELRGSSELANYPDSVILIDRPHNAKNQFILKQVKCRHAAEHPYERFTVLFGEDGAPEFVYDGVVEDMVAEFERCLNDLVLAFEDGREFKRADAVEALTGKFKERTVIRALKLGLEKAVLKKPERGVYVVVVSSEGKESGEPHTSGETQAKLNCSVVPLDNLCLHGVRHNGEEPLNSGLEGSSDLKRASPLALTEGSCRTSGPTESTVVPLCLPLIESVSGGTTPLKRFSTRILLEHMLSNNSDVVAVRPEELAAALSVSEPEVLTALDQLSHTGDALQAPGGAWVAKRRG